MFYCREHDFLYVRVPCTGSTSVVKTFEFTTLCSSDHEGAQAFSGWADYPTARRIGFVRHPVDWVTTVWSAHSLWQDWGISGEVKDHELAEQMATPFDWFMRDGEQVIDEIWRMEDIGEFFRQFGLETPHLNKTKDRKTLSQRAINIIHSRFEREWKFYR